MAQVVGVKGEGVLAFTIDAANPLVINDNGISLAATLSASGTWSMDLFDIVTVDVTNPTLYLNTTDPTNPWLKFQATLTFPELNNCAT